MFQAHIDDQDDPRPYCNALNAVSKDLKETLSQVGRWDTTWLSPEAIAVSLATSHLRHCNHNLSVDDFVELCAYRRTKFQKLAENEVLDSQPINAVELNLLKHDSAVTYSLFGHAASGYTIIRKLVQYSVDEDRGSDEHLISLSLKMKGEFEHEQEATRT
jgi:hypothetical protein